MSFSPLFFHHSVLGNVYLSPQKKIVGFFFLKLPSPSGGFLKTPVVYFCRNRCFKEFAYCFFMCTSGQRDCSTRVMGGKDTLFLCKKKKYKKRRGENDRIQDEGKTKKKNAKYD